VASWQLQISCILADVSGERLRRFYGCIVQRPLWLLLYVGCVSGVSRRLGRGLGGGGWGRLVESRVSEYVCVVSLVDCSAWEQQQQLLLVVDSGLKVLYSAFCLHASSSAQQIARYWLYLTVAQLPSFEGGSRCTLPSFLLECFPCLKRSRTRCRLLYYSSW
jgi:hypothetical protein